MNVSRYVTSGLLCIGLLAGNIYAQNIPSALGTVDVPVTERVSAPVIATWLRLPLAFEKQAEEDVERFVARGPDYAIGLDKGKAIIEMVAKDKTRQAVSLTFAGSSPRSAITGSPLPGTISYIRGSDPQKWRNGLSNYEKITYPEIYPGIDVVYYGNQQQLEFDFVVRPGANPDTIRIKVEGVGKLSIDPSGALILGQTAGTPRVALPQIYQEVNGTRKSVAGHYAIVSRNEVAFQLGAFDRTRTLVIDPTVVYSALLGGSLGYTNVGRAIGVDASGNIVVAGTTDAADFPAVNAAQNGQGGNRDVFIAKINAAGTGLIYSTYLGGSGSDDVNGLAVDSTGAVWIAGVAGSGDFPALNAAQSTFGGGSSDAFVARLSASGALLFSTFLGGNAGDFGTGVAVDAANNGYVAGFFYGTFPTTAGALQSGSSFVAKYGPTGTLLYSALPTPGIAQGIAVDSAGNAYFTGYTTNGPFTGMPVGGAQGTNNGGLADAFIAKLNANATSLTYYTFLGGTGFDQGTGIAVDSQGNAYIAGQTDSPGLGTAGSAQQALAGGIDGFSAKLNPSGTAFTWITYLGGIRQDYLTGLALDGSGNVYVTGYTDSNDFPAVSPLQSSLPGAATSLFRSANSGAAFSPFDTNIPGAVASISVNPASGSVVVLTEAGIYRTTNSGASWTHPFSAPSPFILGQGSYIARSPAAAGTLYVAGYYNAFYRSVDDGVTWISTGSSPDEATGILADPLVVETVYFFRNGAPSMFISTNGGTTWNPLTTGLPVATVGAMIATSDGAVYAAITGFGVYRSIDRGGSWAAVNTGLPAVTAVFANSLSASGTTVLFVTEGVIYSSTNGGANWAATPAPVGAAIVSPSPANPSILYALTASGTIRVSSDGGTTWNVAATGLPPGLPNFPSQLLADPGNSARAFLVTPVNQAAVVAKINGAGSALTWSTYLGGSAPAYAYGIASDGAGNVFVTGNTTSGTGFPVTSAPLPTATYPAFVIKISDVTTACSSLSVSPSNPLVSQNASVLTVSVVAPSGCTWTASTDKPWAVVQTGASGTGDGLVTVQIAASASSTTQSAVLTVGAQSVTIRQPGFVCSYQLDQNSYSVPAAGGSIPAILTATADCPWSVTNNSGAVSIASGASGTGSGTIALTVGLNAGIAQRIFNLPVGNATIQIVQAGGLLAQTLSFISIPDQIFGAAAVALNASVSSGLTVTFASITPAACTVSGTTATGATATMLAVGICSITASQAGNATYAAASSVTNSLLVTPSPQTITFAALSNVAMGTASFTITATSSSGLPVSFTSTTTPVCTVFSSAVTIVGAGTCSITATQSGSVSYGAATPVINSFTVSPGPQTITFGALSSVSLGTAPFTVTATSSVGLPVSFASATTAVCTVSGSTVSGFTVTIVATGTCSITASQTGNANYLAATPVTNSFTVTQGTQTITFGALNSVSFGTAPFTIAATSSAGLPVSFASTTTPVCTVSGATGSTVTVVAAGTCSITASQTGNANYLAATSVTNSFTVTPSPQTITFGALPDVSFGTAPFTLTATSSASLPVSFVSTTTPVCTVSGSTGTGFTVTIVAAGTCSITASQLGNANVASATPVTRTFTVIPASPACDINSDGNTNVADVQLIINEALGVIPATHDLNHDGAVNVADVQKIINAALGLACSVQ